MICKCDGGGRCPSQGCSANTWWSSRGNTLFNTKTTGNLCLWSIWLVKNRYWLKVMTMRTRPRAPILPWSQPRLSLLPTPSPALPAPLFLALRYCPSWERTILLYVMIIQSKRTLNLGGNVNGPRFVCVYSNVCPHVLRKAFVRVLETPLELDPWKWRWLLVVRPGEETYHCQGMCSSDNNSLLLDKETTHASFNPKT